jgi:hypothetical protein
MHCGSLTSLSLDLKKDGQGTGAEAMRRETKRIGRPMKAPRGKARVSLGLKVTAEVKRHVDAAAKASGRTQSQEAEALIEYAIETKKLLADMRTTVAEIDRGSIVSALKRRNWREQGGGFFPPEVHGLPPNAFIPQEEQEKDQ